MSQDNRVFRIRGEVFKKYGVEQSASGDEITFDMSGSNVFGNNYKKVTFKDGEYVGLDLVQKPYFGFESAQISGAKKVLVVHEPMDVLHMQQIINVHTREQYSDNKPAVMYIDKGDSETLSMVAKKFKETVVMTNDADFRQSVAKFNGDIMFAEIPKDNISESRGAGGDKAVFSNAMFGAKSHAEMGARLLSDLITDALKPIEMGLSYPWENVTTLTYGQRKKEVVALGAAAGSGKSTLMHEIAAWNVVKHNWNGYLVMMEETNRETLLNVAGKVDAIPYHVPETSFDRDTFINTATDVGSKLKVWNPEEAPQDGAEARWEGIKDDIVSNKDWLDFVMLDNVTTLTEGMDASARNEFIAKIAKESADLAMKCDIEIFLVSHLNNPSVGKMHEEGGMVLESQFTGSRAIPRYSHVIFGFERNKHAVDPSCSLIRLIKHRKYGKTGITKTYYNAETGKINEMMWDDRNYESIKIDSKNKGASVGNSSISVASGVSENALIGSNYKENKPKIDPALVMLKADIAEKMDDNTDDVFDGMEIDSNIMPF